MVCEGREHERSCTCTHVHGWHFLQSLSAFFTEPGPLTPTCLPTALLRGYPVSASWDCMCSESLLIFLKVLGFQILVFRLGWELLAELPTEELVHSTWGWILYNWWIIHWIKFTDKYCVGSEVFFSPCFMVMTVISCGKVIKHIFKSLSMPSTQFLQVDID